MKLYLFTLLCCVNMGYAVVEDEAGLASSRDSNLSYIKGYGDRSIDLIELCRTVHMVGGVLPITYKDRVVASLNALNRKEYALPEKKEMENVYEKAHRERLLSACVWAMEFMNDDKDKWPRITEFISRFK